MGILRGDFGVIFWTHLMIVLATYFSPILFTWKIIASYITFYFLQILTIKECILSKLQFRKPVGENSFHHYYLNKMGVKVSREKLRSIGKVIPFLILSLALILQLILDINPLII